jgi:hypothetical protein
MTADTLKNVALATQVATLHAQKQKLVAEVGTLLGTLVAADDALKEGRITEAHNIIHRELYKTRSLQSIVAMGEQVQGEKQPCGS